MLYAPAAELPQVEIHYMEHGLLMLSGSGPYLLGDSTYPVQAGDFIWMAPFCPQFFQADPSTPRQIPNLQRQQPSPHALTRSATRTTSS